MISAVIDTTTYCPFVRWLFSLNFSAVIRMKECFWLKILSANKCTFRMAPNNKFSSMIIYRSGNNWKITENKKFQFLPGNTTWSNFPGLKRTLSGVRIKKPHIDRLRCSCNNIFCCSCWKKRNNCKKKFSLSLPFPLFKWPP